MTDGLRALVEAALTEDLGQRPDPDSGRRWADADVTAAATVAADRRDRAAFVTRKAGVIAGTAAVQSVYAVLDDDVEIVVVRGDGERVEAGEVVAEVSGPTRVLLAGERTALNLLTHLSGVATLTARYADEVAGLAHPVALRDTRKTLPGLRALQKQAVASGGGVNHRFGLHDGVLVKDNHVAAAGGVAAATARALEAAGDRDVQIEVDTMAELEEALGAGAPAVLLDNFDLNELPAAVARCRRETREVFVEASGGVGLETVWAIANTGVDAIAVGALTHSPPALDIGLDFVPATGG